MGINTKNKANKLKASTFAIALPILGAMEKRQILLSHYCKNKDFNSAQKIIWHFEYTNIIFTD